MTTSDLSGTVRLKAVEKSFIASQLLQATGSMAWIECNDDVVAIWSADVKAVRKRIGAWVDLDALPCADLILHAVTPFVATGFRAMDVGVSPDGMRYMVGGAIANEVAILMFEAQQPET